MSLVKRTLSLIPRPIVNLVPIDTRDRWRTSLLKRERARQRRRTRSDEKGLGRPGAESAQTVAEVRAVVAAYTAEIEAEFQRLDTRLTEIVTRIDQLDARLSTAMSGDAPSPLDDLTDLIKPIQQLQESLETLHLPEDPTRTPR